MKEPLDCAAEAAKLAAFFGDDRVGALALVERQLAALQIRAQMVLGFAAVAVTTTGFSGRLIAGTNLAAQVLVIAGLAVILASCFYLFKRVLSVEWVITRSLGPDFPAALAAMIAHRNRKTRAYRAGSTAVLAGFIIYGAAIAIMLIHPEPLQVPVR
ncbi:MAG: hypothetical protein N2322_01435 [Terrimicrobiaceae bacterium]|nr:hypothetical protein [Terrimicrobiaceae bacterium]